MTLSNAGSSSRQNAASSTKTKVEGSLREWQARAISYVPPCGAQLMLHDQCMLNVEVFKWTRDDAGDLRNDFPNALGLDQDLFFLASSFPSPFLSPSILFHA